MIEYLPLSYCFVMIKFSKIILQYASNGHKEIQLRAEVPFVIDIGN